MAKILVVDDEAKILKMVSDYLEAVGFKVTGAADGISALKKFREEEFDLIVLDFMMPGIDGITFIDSVREMKGDPVIIVLTSKEDPDTIIDVMKRGVFDYIIKPVTRDNLAIKINRAFQELWLLSLR